MTIHILPAEIASQIAAGEVVERPASVVKELVENALDAGATHITIRTAEAGKRLIEVSDDGSGIPSNELSLAVERHATSKLQQASDLFQIATLGFRGEALASIGSVSRMTLVSRPPESPTGGALRVEAGRVGKTEITGAPHGTLIKVEDLFFNVPARLKFLKHDTTERNQIDQLVMRYALAYPKVRFHLTHDERVSIKTSGNADRMEVLGLMYGAEIARQMLEVKFTDDDLKISGYISPTRITRSNRREITLLVNGRPVQEPALSTAVMKGYQTLLMVGRFPIAVILLEIPPEAVDVNVHPTKSEVRFRQPDRIFSGIQNAIRRSLLAHNPIAGLEGQLRWNQTTHLPPTSWDWRMAGEYQVESEATAGLEGEFPISTQSSMGQEQLGIPGQRIPLLRLVGQIANAYLVAEAPDGLYLVDQHAAHERVLFERFLEQRSQSIPSQSLLQPAIVELSPSGARLLDEQLPILHKLGFQVEPFGPNTYLMRAIPSLLKNLDPAEALKVVVEDFEENEEPLQAESEARLIARVCKRAAVKAGRALSPEEGRNLLSDLEACRSPRTCPHGRPTMIYLSVDLLERQFGRKGAR